MKKRIASAFLSTLLLLPLCCAITSAANSVNSPPTVIPAIREWEGSTGGFVFGDTVKISVTEAEISEAKKQIIADSFKSYLNILVVFTSENADISLITVPFEEKLGKDGYTLDITENNITVSASADIGLLYGIYTLLQSAKVDGKIPCGKAVDYSYYKHRGGMIDVARAWVPLEYVEEITKYFSFFKLNEIHLHINDVGENNYFIFRLESDVKGLTATDGYYTKEAYRAYQKRMLEYGVEVITEIDTPAHSACFSSAVPEYMMDTVHIDISNPKAVQFVKDLFDEYITGDDPVFVSKRVHIGTDEYPEGYNELMREYTDTLIKHINSRGYIPRFWGSFGGDGFNGETPVSSEAEANFWAVSLSDYNTMLNMGYDLINTCGPVLYIVPGGNYGFVDYYNLQYLYSGWFVNYLGYNSSTSIDPDHPQLLGADFALWNDTYTRYGGFSYHDIFDRLRGAVCLISEKTWCGEQTRNIPAEDFIARYDALSLYAPLGDAGRHSVADINKTVPEGVKSFGWPYVASVDVTLNSLDTKITLFGGEEGEFYISSDGSAGFKRGVYDFKYRCNIPVGETTNIKLIADNRQTLLCVDDTYYYYPVNTKNPSLVQSSTFVLPLEQIGAGIDGSVENLTVKSETVDINNYAVNGNYALNKPVTVSALEVTDGRFKESFAVDGNLDTRLSFSAKADEQWMVVDLQTIHNVNKVVIDFYEHISDYSVLVSVDGIDFTEVARIQQGVDQAKQVDTVTFDTVEARYIKYQQHKRFYISDWNTYYSGGIREFEVYGFEPADYNALVNKASKYILDKKASTDDLRKSMSALASYLQQEHIFNSHLQALAEKLQADITAYEAEAGNTSKTASDASEVSQPEKYPKTHLGVWLAAGVGAVALLSAAAFALIKRKKK